MTSDEALSEVNRQFEEERAVKQAKAMGMGYIDIGNFPINPDLLYILDEEQASKGRLMPFFRVGKKLRVAIESTDNPETKKILDFLRGQQYQLNLNICSSDGMTDALKMYKSELYKKEEEYESEFEEVDLGAYEAEIEELSKMQAKMESMAPAEAIHLIMVGAVKTSASDVHIEAYEKFAKIRYRIDGILQDIMQITNKAYEHVRSQLKYQAKVKLNVTAVPQDGRFAFMVNERKIDVRFSTLPSAFGESMVMRLLDSARHIPNLEELGFMGKSHEDVKWALEQPNGMILTTGPTGSGKTTTLYTMLNEVNTPETKIITLENPVEFNLAGVVQSQINHDKGYDFAQGLRSILRQDPDVVMVGEIRDLETAEIAAQAALTGHQVFSTLHTNSALGVLPRLLNMGLEPYMTAPSLRVIIAQRLVRKICEDCKEEYVMEGNVKEYFDEIKMGLLKRGVETKIPDKFYKGKGCEKCSETGYRGRVGLYEVFRNTEHVQALILKKAPAEDLHEALNKQGMITMREDGFIKVTLGLTTMDEVLRVTADVG